MTLKAFETSGLPSSKIAATTASASGVLNKDSTAARIVNAGPNNVRIRFSGPSGAAIAAIATDMLLLANSAEVFSKGNATFWTAITDTGTAAVEATDGEGF